MKNNVPNIFEYATKELSQDAMICWLLSCINCSDKRYKKIGLNFIRFIFDDDKIEEREISLEEGPLKQLAHMDVYAVVKLRGDFWPIIFENKTNTYLHDDQFNNYCKKLFIFVSVQE